MDISNFDVRIKHGAANLADTGLRYVGFGGLFGLGLLVTATVLLNTRIGRGLSWLQQRLVTKRESLLDGISGRKSDQQQTAEDLEVPQERETVSSESEHQADSDGKQMEEQSTPTTIGELINQQMLSREKAVAASVDGMLTPVDDQIPFDQVTSAVSPMPMAADEEQLRASEVPS